MALVLLFLGISACSRKHAALSEPKQHVTLTMGVQAAAGVNPAYGLNQIIRLLSLEGLVTTTADGRAVGRLVSDWSKSSDGLTWRFRLRPNVKFHDGSPLDAGTVKQSLDAVVRAKSIGGLPAMVDVKDVEAVSPTEITVHLEQPSTFLLEDMNLPITHDGSGTGAFYPSSRSAGEAVMNANDSYYLGRPTIDRVVIKPYTSLRTAWADMMRGSVAFLYDVNQDALDFVRQSSAVRVFPVSRPYAYIVFLNLHVPGLRSPLVRRAMNAGVDRDKLVKVGLQGTG
ncbi:MAG TPA: ABC transporter substrate-binding protein, partial [Vicinamibacterales bacterium]